LVWIIKKTQTTQELAKERRGFNDDGNKNKNWKQRKTDGSETGIEGGVLEICEVYGKT